MQPGCSQGGTCRGSPCAPDPDIVDLERWHMAMFKQLRQDYKFVKRAPPKKGKEYQDLGWQLTNARKSLKDEIYQEFRRDYIFRFHNEQMKRQLRQLLPMPTLSQLFNISSKNGPSCNGSSVTFLRTWVSRTSSVARSMPSTSWLRSLLGRRLRSPGPRQPTKLPWRKKVHVPIPSPRPPNSLSSATRPSASYVLATTDIRTRSACAPSAASHTWWTTWKMFIWNINWQMRRSFVAILYVSMRVWFSTTSIILRITWKLCTASHSGAKVCRIGKADCVFYLRNTFLYIRGQLVPVACKCMIRDAGLKRVWSSNYFFLFWHMELRFHWPHLTDLGHWALVLDNPALKRRNVFFFFLCYQIERKIKHYHRIEYASHFNHASGILSSGVRQHRLSSLAPNSSIICK